MLSPLPSWSYFLRSLDYWCQSFDDLQRLAVGVVFSSLLRVHDDPAGTSITIAFQVIDRRATVARINNSRYLQGVGVPSGLCRQFPESRHTFLEGLGTRHERIPTIIRTGDPLERLMTQGS